ncbi:N-acetyltransferase GCN5 [Opitutaceae bacterium TAV5]|nr:N-acetyltransferase GCN5 [Opitutaceae bacterium TAV5]
MDNESSNHAVTAATVAPSPLPASSPEAPACACGHTPAPGAPTACSLSSAGGCNCSAASLAARLSANSDPTRPPLQIRPAAPADVALLHRLVSELASYESLSHEVESTPSLFAEHLFGVQRRANALLAHFHGIPAGFAVWYPTYSTFAGRPGAFLEDLYVRPALRRQGIGRALLTAAANAASEDGCTRLEWRALKWNTPALDFYKSIGATPLSEWTTLRRELA